jgi:hypothetical protein
MANMNERLDRLAAWFRENGDREDVVSGNVWPDDPEMTDLEHDLLASLNFAIGTAEGTIVDCRRRWS